MNSRRAKLAHIEHKTQAVMMIMVVAMLILMIQLWLLNAAIEAYLAAQTHIAVPSFVASLFCFGLNLCALGYLRTLDRK